MAEKKAPKELRCEWIARTGKDKGGYDCAVCKGWTFNLPLYRNTVCPHKDRRDHSTRDRRAA